MEPNPLSIRDIATVLYCQIDDELKCNEHDQAKLSVSELVTIGVLFALKGTSSRRFHTWLRGNLGGCFPKLPERSRLQRRMIQYQQLVKEFLAQPKVIDQNIDTSDATGRLLFNMLGAIAQFETEIMAERQMDGIQKAKERGVQFGRQKQLSLTEIKELKAKRKQGVLIKTLMKDYGLSKASVYRYLA